MITIRIDQLRAYYRICQSPSMYMHHNFELLVTFRCEQARAEVSTWQVRDQLI